MISKASQRVSSSPEPKLHSELEDSERSGVPSKVQSATVPSKGPPESLHSSGTSLPDTLYSAHSAQTSLDDLSRFLIQDEQPGASNTDEQDNFETSEPEEEEAGIVPAPNNLSSDDGYDSDAASVASTSLSDSACDFVYENGRRYHRFRQGRYNFPNDEREQERENLKHGCLTLLCAGKLYFAPLDEHLHRILDIGTGTGAWVMDSRQGQYSLARGRS